MNIFSIRVIRVQNKYFRKDTVNLLGATRLLIKSKMNHGDTKTLRNTKNLGDAPVPPWFKKQKLSYAKKDQIRPHSNVFAEK